MERGLRRSDPHLAAMLAIFATLTVGEVITSTEQRNAVRHWIRRVLAVTACARRAMRGIGRVCTAVRRRFRGSVRQTVGLPSDSRLHGLLDAGPDRSRRWSPVSRTDAPASAAMPSGSGLPIGRRKMRDMPRASWPSVVVSTPAALPIAVRYKQARGADRVSRPGRLGRERICRKRGQGP
jgi:hypothetical protein